MSLITQEELSKLQQASARADQRVMDLLTNAKQGDYFGPKLRVAGDMGDYVVPPILSWQSLYDVVRNPELGDIDYSIKKYPHFDGIIDQHCHSDEFINPLNAKYEKWQNLRDNIACVRNYLLIYYFEQNPQKISEDKAEAMLEEIATFVGKGCYNNFLFLGLIPNHNPLEAFIDVEKANQPDGEGARYIYERILARNRNNNWMKPFDAVIRLFGGSGVNDWQLPDVADTPFHPAYSQLVTEETVTDAMLEDALDDAENVRNLLMNAYSMHDQQSHLRNQALDLDGLGNQMLYSAASAHHITGLQEPVRRDAVEIAKDILRKLRVSMGNINIKDGLKLNPEDDVSALGAIKGVMMVYEKMIAHARSVDASILNHPAVIGATQAFGQFGYMAKLEAYRIANAAGDSRYAQMLSDQLGRIPDYFAVASHRTFGEMIQRIETGMDVMLERMQQISGPASFLSTDARDTVGMSMATPTAGLQAQVASAIGVQGNMQAQQANMAADQAARTQAARMMAEQARQSGAQQTTSNPVSSSGTGRSALADAKKTTQSTNTGTIDPRLIRTSIAGSQSARKATQQTTPPVVNSQQQRAAQQGIPPLVLKAMQDAQIRAANIVSANHHHDDHHHPGQMLPSNGLKPMATPNAKTDKPKTEPVPVPKNLAEAEELRRKQQQQLAAQSKPGRTI